MQRKAWCEIVYATRPGRTTLLAACPEVNAPSQKVLRIPASRHQMADKQLPVFQTSIPAPGTRIIVWPPLLFPPMARMSRNFSDNRLSRDETYDLHFTMPHGTLQRINLPYLFDAFVPGWRWDAPGFCTSKHQEPRLHHPFPAAAAHPAFPYQPSDGHRASDLNCSRNTGCRTFSPETSLESTFNPFFQSIS
jgi:hypothetical protein